MKTAATNTWAVVCASALISVAGFALMDGGAGAQADVSDAELVVASRGRVVRVGPGGGASRPVTTVPLELYVARVLAGEGEPNAPDAARQALAVAIRTYAVTNLGRHGRDRFDLCDSTHCQVPRAPTAATRRTALATAGQILAYNGRPAHLFYSASCGGYSESAAEVWPDADYPYLQTTPDDVHRNDPPWTLTLTLEQIERALERAGFEGQLRDVRIDARNASGRAARLEVQGLSPGVIAGDQFRAAIGPTTLRSTAFSIDRTGSSVRFTGRGFGHGVGMCVIGASRRAVRGESMQAILEQYYPGLELVSVHGGSAARRDRDSPRNPPHILGGDSSKWPVTELGRFAQRAHYDLSRVLGVSVEPITVRVHESIESFRGATGRPWWISSAVEGTTIDLVPVGLLEQRDGVEGTVRLAVAELLVSESLRGRPAWVRVGAARFFARGRTQGEPPPARCPADAELTRAVSAAAQRDANARAETCFARAYAKQRDWRAIR